MWKAILCFVCALAILSACEKAELNNTDDLNSKTNPSDTIKVTTRVVGLSFTNDVVPVLTMCNNCHHHGWTNSTVTPTFYTNLVNQGYVKPATYTSCTIYAMINSGHPGTSSISKANTDKIINWMMDGSKNN